MGLRKNCIFEKAGLQAFSSEITILLFLIASGNHSINHFQLGWQPIVLSIIPLNSPVIPFSIVAIFFARYLVLIIRETIEQNKPNYSDI